MTNEEREQIADILDRRANEIANFYNEYGNNPNHLDSVELALTREMGRLRHLAILIEPESEVGEE